MRNYVIINGVNSLTIQGLAINNLPPITKPMIRTQREEIDGRDGDIVTELGYSAYDKQMEIGLYGNFDIDAIIKYFTGEGTIVFSNEADKYYNFKILDQIDYEKLLKFKTAVVTFHCQPFKYPLEEEPEEAEITTITGTGESITLENVEEAPMKIVYKGNTYQNGEPTPESPQEIQVVSGDNSIEVCGKNLFSGWTKGKGIRASTGEIIDNTTGAISDYISVNFNTNPNYYISGLDVNLTSFIAAYNSSNQFLGRTGGFARESGVLSINSFTSGTPQGTGDIAYVIVYQYKQPSDTGSIDDLDTMPTQLELGSTATDYEPYIGKSYPINLGVENILDFDTILDYWGATYTKENGTYTLTNRGEFYARPYTLNLEVGKTYTLSGVQVAQTSSNLRLEILKDSTIVAIQSFSPETTVSGKTFTVEEGHTYKIRGNYSTGGYPMIISKPQLEEGTKQNSFTPYGQTPIKMRGIGTYEDYFVRNSDGQWCKYNAIGEVVLNGSEHWTYVNSSFRHNVANLNTTGNDVIKQISNYFKAITYSSIWSSYDYFVCYTLNGNVVLKNKDITNINDFKTWLSTHNTQVDYVLATPYLSLIESETLIEQLDALETAMSYKGQTNITQTNNDLPFIMDVSALELGSDHLIINNTGTSYSKPTIDIDGTGIVDIYLNDEQIFEIDLTNQNEIIIDTEKMEAYTPDNLLANRLVTGDYSNFKLAPGENDLRFSGDLTKATVTNYIRWI